MGEPAPPAMLLRRIASVVLGFVAVLGVVGMVLGAWARWTLLDTERFMEVVTPVVESPAVTDALGAYVAEEAFEVLEVERRVEDSLTRIDDYLASRLEDLLGGRGADRLEEAPRLADLAGPLTSSARQRVTESAQAVIGSEAVGTLVTEAVEESHRVAVAVVREDYDSIPNLSVIDEAVMLDLSPIIARVVERQASQEIEIAGIETSLGALADVVVPDEARERLAEALEVRLGPDFGRITVLSADQVQTLRWAVGLLDAAVWAFAGLTAAALLGSIWMAANRVRATLFLAVGILLALATTWSGLRQLESSLSDAVDDPLAAALALEVIPATLSGLRSLMGWIMGLATVALVLSLLASSAGIRSIRSVRGALEDGRVGTLARAQGDALIVGGVGVAVLAMMALDWGPVGIVVLLALVAAWVAAIRALGRDRDRSVP